MCAKIFHMKAALINVSSYGSTGRICGGIARCLQRAGHSAKIYYGRGGPYADLDSFRADTQADILLHAGLARAADSMGMHSLRATRRLIRELEKDRPDLIHLHNLHGYWLSVGTLFAYLKTVSVPVIWTLHDCWPMTGHCAFFPTDGCEKWKTGCSGCRWNEFYPKRLFWDASGRNYRKKKEWFSGMPDLTLTAPSDWLRDLTRESILKEYPAVTLYNGINRNAFRPTETRVRETYGIRLEEKLVLGVASVWDRRKGLDLFLKMSEDLPECRFAAVGLNRDQIRALPARVIGIERTESLRELAGWYSAADVFVNPTRADNFPTTHLEALACGTPVAAFDTGGCSEAFDPLSGASAPEGNLPALEDAVRRCMALSREDCLRRSERFDEDRCFGEMIGLYENTLARRSES